MYHRLLIIKLSVSLVCWSIFLLSVRPFEIIFSLKIVLDGIFSQLQLYLNISSEANIPSFIQNTSVKRFQSVMSVMLFEWFLQCHQSNWWTDIDKQIMINRCISTVKTIPKRNIKCAIQTKDLAIQGCIKRAVFSK